MYIPPSFVVSDLSTLHDFIEDHSFGVLVSQLDGLPFATHLPFLLDRSRGSYGTLFGHMARANPQWTQFAHQQVMALFSGPHTYISPSWYQAENVVPTWNYIAVHVYGCIEPIEAHDALVEIVQRSVQLYEHAMPNPWVLDASTTFVDRLLSQIVGFRLEITSIEGKWKLSQNHPVERQKKVIARLQERHDENSQDVARMMQSILILEGQS
jgi:transcriptional regulator